MKTIFDTIVALVALIFLFPIFVLISLIIKTTSSGEVFYKGIRAGKNNINFKKIDDLYNKLDYLLEKEGPSFLEIIVEPGSRKDLGRPTIKPIENKKSFMNYS